MLIIFKNVHETLSAEKTLKEENIVHQVVPVPPYVNEGCGLGIRIDAKIHELVVSVFDQNKIAVEQWIEEQSD
jgi:predicted HicB family RNase H-like nuclease